ncbi:phosphatase PAP2 family protein [Kineosporia sp. J2-2]|uniref:Phosphatase PAP2 family protein n=1 Tax=Kineosporia corallincola TaxID=2835133 RepID=A0ABS5TPF8_9ACTN|nr:phosphatase PAP2 family protein [Kineosporia corallincola]MBT0772985.1 phosphatase PAP2 family protein [Kineosporia corallincola]
MDVMLRSRVRRLVRAAVYAVVVAVPFALLAYLVRTGFDPLARADQSVIVAATRVARTHPAFLQVLEVWQEVSQPLVGYPLIGLPVCLWMWLRRSYVTRAWWAIVTMLVGWMLGWSLKLAVERARPVVEDPVSQPSGYSFPSGHVLNATVLASTLIVLVWPVLPSRARPFVLGLGGAWVAITCADRLFLGAHFPSDVIGGVMLGVGLVWAAYAGYRGWTPNLPPPAPDDPARNPAPAAKENL